MNLAVNLAVNLTNLPRLTAPDSVPISAKASLVPKAPQAEQQSRRDATQEQQRRTHLRAADAQGLTEAEAHVPGAKACQVPGRSKCQGVCAVSWARAMWA